MSAPPSDLAFSLLFDEPADGPPSLPEPIRAIYQGDWRMPEMADRPYTFMNFVTSRDGRVSFNVPGFTSGAEVAGFSAADAWLMGLLRARADAVLVGEGTMRVTPEHVWSAEYIYPAAAALFGELRRSEGRPSLPLHVLLTLDGQLVPDAAILHTPGLRLLVATTGRGARAAEPLLRGASADVELLALGEETVDLPLLMAELRGRYGVRALLCEGGPRVYGSLLQAGVVDEEFLTLSPLMLGEAPGAPRPSLVEGSAFAPGQAPVAELLSLRRVGHHLFLRSRWTYSHLAT
jgi:5-amino-6-(5-phosphoribosylamino)uracil reductase